MSLKRFIKTQVLSSYNKDSKEIEKKEKKENVFNDNIDDRIGVFKSKERIIFLIGVVSIFFSSIISVFAANYLYSSSEVSFDNSSSGISSDNVQGAIDELYQNASDYSSLESRIGVLEGRWQNSPESYFDGNDLILKQGSSGGNIALSIRDSSNAERGAFYYQASGDQMRLISKTAGGSVGSGKLDLRGNPVTVNGTSITGPTKLNLTANTGTLATNNSFSIGNAVFLNLKFTGINVANGTTYTLTTIPNYSSSESSCMTFMAYGTSRYPGVCWIRANGQVAVAFANTLNNAEIRVVSAGLK